MKKTIFILSFILLLSCSGGNNMSEHESAVEIIDCKQDYIFLADSLSTRFIPLETTEDCLIGSVSEIQIKNNLIFILEGKKKEDLCVFDMDGKFVARIGERGNGPGQYIQINSFDIDTSNNEIIISDKQRGRILFFDLKTYQFKYAKKPDFYYSDFICMPDKELLFFGCNGFRNPKKLRDSNSYYIQSTDSLLNPEDTFLKADFTTPYTNSVRPGKTHLYRNEEGDIYAYHHLFPYVWRYKKGELTQKYLIKFEGYEFPDVEYLKGESSSSDQEKDYSNALEGSNFIYSYRMDESSNMICFSIIKNMAFLQAVYNKKQKKGYLFSLKDYFRSMNLGMIMFPGGATEDCIIGVIAMDGGIEKVKEDTPLYEILKGKSEDDNPILCLYKWKN